MYDRNGLQLSPVNETLNAYRMTSVDLKTRKYNAYARAHARHQNDWSMFDIGTQFKDPRDAAFVAQEFEKKFDKHAVRQMHTDGIFYDISRDFVANLEIPEWQFPAEGLSMEDMTGDHGYKTNRVEDEKAALIEAYKVFGVKPAPLKEIPVVLKKVKELYSNGLSLREAAKVVVKG